MYCIQHCFICRLSDSTVSEDAGIEPRTVAIGSQRSNHSARSHPQSARSQVSPLYLVPPFCPPPPCTRWLSACLERQCWHCQLVRWPACCSPGWCRAGSARACAQERQLTTRKTARSRDLTLILTPKKMEKACGKMSEENRRSEATWLSILSEMDIVKQNRKIKKNIPRLSTKQKW